MAKRLVMILALLLLRIAPGTRAEEDWNSVMIIDVRPDLTGQTYLSIVKGYAGKENPIHDVILLGTSGPFLDGGPLIVSLEATEGLTATHDGSGNIRVDSERPVAGQVRIQAVIQDQTSGSRWHSSGYLAWPLKWASFTLGPGKSKYRPYRVPEALLPGLSAHLSGLDHLPEPEPSCPGGGP